MIKDNSNRHVVIVGAGAVGLSLAWELAKRDFKVTVFDAKEIGRATSWAAAGILPPANFDAATDPIDRLRGLSHRLFPEWARQLESETGIDTGFRQCGGWYLADTPGERAAMIGMADYWHEMNIECESVSLSEFAKREPQISHFAAQRTDAAAWWVPDEFQIRSPHYLSALESVCGKLNVTLRDQTQVVDIAESKQGVRVMIVGGESITADHVVVCGGVGTGQVAQWMRLQDSIVPIRGQMLLLKSASPLINSVINVGHRYLVSRDDGHTLIGSCEEEVGLQLGTTPEMLNTLRKFAFDLCPALSEAEEIKAWSGLRPMTFDGFPMIGRVPETTNVYVAAGHFRSGLHLAPATAVVLADLMTGQAPTVDLSAFRVGKQQRSFEPH